MLLRDMLEEVRPFWPYSSAWVAVLAVEYDLARESMSMRWDVQGAPLHSGEWEIHCRGVREVRMARMTGHDLQLTGSHPLLIPYREPSIDLFFRGAPDDPKALIGELCLTHRAIFGDWVSPSGFLNERVADLEALVAGGAGLLATGPESVIQEYGAVLQRRGISTRLFAYDPSRLAGAGSERRSDSDVEVLILDQSYVVAREFTGEIIE